MENLLFRLCNAFSGSGQEENAAKVIENELHAFAKVKTDLFGNVIATMGNNDSNYSILLDAHMDQIGMIVTNIFEDGFIKIAPCGGIDCRVLPGSMVLIHGKKTINGIVCTVPPHLATQENDKFLSVNELYIDTGLKDDVIKNISLGDRVSFRSFPKRLIGNRIKAQSLDNKVGVAALIRCAQLLAQEHLNIKVIFSFSTREEVGAQGAKIVAFEYMPNESIVVDASFARQPGVAEEKSGEYSHGPMIGIAPTLSKSISNHFIEISKKFNIPYQIEVMGSLTGTNADEIMPSGCGVRTGLLSIPIRYMHTPVEVVDVYDIENTANLLFYYILKGAIHNA